MFPIASRHRRVGLPATLRGPVRMPTLEPERKVRHVMTVGIGIVCQQGQCVVLAADGKGSFENEVYPAHERISKMLNLAFGLCISFAGTVSVCHSLMNRIATGLEHLPQESEPELDAVMKSIEAARFSEIYSRVDYQMRRDLAMSLEEWKGFGSATLQYRRGQKLIRRYYLPAEFLIGGLIRNSGVVLYSVDKEKIDPGPLACVGTGGDAAYAKLMERNQEVSMSLPRTLLHVAEAMEAARVNNPKTVGEPADYVVLTKLNFRRMPARSPILTGLKKLYSGADTRPIDSSQTDWDAVQGALYEPGISEEEYNSGLRSPKQRVKP